MATESTCLLNPGRGFELFTYINYRKPINSKQYDRHALRIMNISIN